MAEIVSPGIYSAGEIRCSRLAIDQHLDDFMEHFEDGLCSPEVDVLIVRIFMNCEK